MSVLASLVLATLVACGSDAGPDESGGGVVPSTSGAPSGTPAPGSSTAPAGTATAPVTPPPVAPLGAPYPIVLVHGMAGFDQLTVGPIGVTYFAGVAADLTAAGEQVHVVTVPPYDTSESRAQALSKQIDDILLRTGKGKVNLVGHSQGGLDARVLVSPQGLGYGDRVASVTTVATPHHGSKISDVVLGLVSGIPSSVVDSVTGAVLSLLQKSAYDLQSDPHLRAQMNEISERNMTTVFNPKYKDAPGVVYTSYAGRTNLRTGIGVCDGGAYPNKPLDLDVAQAPFAPLALFLEQGRLEVNDGLVTVKSARWGTFQTCVPADHLKEVGMFAPAANSFDHLQLFRDIVSRVRSAGF